MSVESDGSDTPPWHFSGGVLASMPPSNHSPTHPHRAHSSLILFGLPIGPRHRSCFASELTNTLNNNAMSTYTLVGHHGSTCSRTVIATLEEVGAQYDIKTIDIMTGEHKAADYIAKYQPFGQIPALVDGDYILFESRAIARYVASKANAEELYPTDLKARGLVDAWLSVNQSNSGPIVDIVGEFFFGPFLGATPDETKRAPLTEKLNGLFDVLEKQLTKSKFLAGDHFTLADLSFLAYTTYLLQAKGFEAPFEGHKHVKAWWETISNRPSWKKATSHGFGY